MTTRHILYLFLTLAAFWLLNSGIYSGLMLSLGAGSIAFVMYISHRMNVVDHESQPILLSWKLPLYLLWLCREIVVANAIVVKHIWLGGRSISPTLATINVTQDTDLGKMIYANSITLTPGTVTVDVVGNQFTVHSLMRENIDALKCGDMDRRVSELEN